MPDELLYLVAGALIGGVIQILVQLLRDRHHSRATTRDSRRKAYGDFLTAQTQFVNSRVLADRGRGDDDALLNALSAALGVLLLVAPTKTSRVATDLYHRGFSIHRPEGALAYRNTREHFIRRAQRDVGVRKR